MTSQIVIDSEGNWLNDAAAASFVRMRADGMPVDDVTVGGRSRERQAELYAGWVNRLPGYNFALPPGQSRHEIGMALDVNGGMRTWMALHGAEYGWRRTNPNESWHFDYFYAEDKHVGRVTAPVPIEKEEDEMTPDERESLNECRTMLGVLLGWNAPRTDGEAAALARLRGDGIAAAAVSGVVNHDNVTEPRRMLGALLGWNAGKGPEPKRIAEIID